MPEIEGGPEVSPIQLDPIEKAASSLVKEVLKDLSIHYVEEDLFLLPIMRFRTERALYLARNIQDFIDWFSTEVKGTGYEEEVLIKGRGVIYHDYNSGEPKINAKLDEFRLLVELWQISEMSEEEL